MTQEIWTSDSWRAKEALQQPKYSDQKLLNAVEKELAKQPSLVIAGEVERLKKDLGNVARGNAFLLQGGDCAESFYESNERNISDTFRAILQMAVVLTYGGGKPVVKLGRIAGQFAKPRSSDMETQGSLTLPSYRGDMVNGLDFTEEARKPDPNRILMGYFRSAATLNLLRAYAKGGCAGLNNVRSWNLGGGENTPQGEQYRDVTKRIEESLRFMAACGINVNSSAAIGGTEFYTSHEALLLPYEQALTRRDSVSGGWYDLSAHQLWIGDRTRQLGGAHVEYLRGVKNPIGLKCGPTMAPDELLRITDILNPSNEPGRLTLVVRMGANKIEECLPPLVRAMREVGREIVWCSDPMHCNTYTSATVYKTRAFEKIASEVLSFFGICESEGVHPGGIHLEMTGRNVTECTGCGVTEENLGERYETHCDPRLNATQALELALLIADRLGKTQTVCSGSPRKKQAKAPMAG